MAPKQQDERWGCPECIEWMKAGRRTKRLPKDVLSYEEIEKMAEGTEEQRKKVGVV